MQNQTNQLTASNVTALENMSLNTSASSHPINSLPGSAAAGNVIVPSFVSTYCTLGNSSLSHPSLSSWLPRCRKQSASHHKPVLLSHVFYCHLGSLSRFFATQTFCRRPRIFSHSREAVYKNKGRAIYQSGGPATRKHQGPGFQAPNVPGWETARVY